MQIFVNSVNSTAVHIPVVPIPDIDGIHIVPTDMTLFIDATTITDSLFEEQGVILVDGVF